MIVKAWSGNLSSSAKGQGFEGITDRLFHTHLLEKLYKLEQVAI